MRNAYLRIIFFTILISALIVYSGFLYENHKTDSHSHDHSDHYHDHSHSEKISLPEKLLFPSREPDRVILNLTENPETSIAVNWRTDTTVLAGTIEWAIATPGTEFLNIVQKVNATKERLKVVREGDP